MVLLMQPKDLILSRDTVTHSMYIDDVSLIILVLGCVGLTLITSMGHIFKPLKEKIKNPTLLIFSMCPQCVGWHAGFWTYIIFFFEPLNLMFWLWSVIFGGMISLLSMIAQRLVS